MENQSIQIKISQQQERTNDFVQQADKLKQTLSTRMTCIAATHSIELDFGMQNTNEILMTNVVKLADSLSGRVIDLQTRVDNVNDDLAAFKRNTLELNHNFE